MSGRDNHPAPPSFRRRRGRKTFFVPAVRRLPPPQEIAPPRPASVDESVRSLRGEGLGWRGGGEGVANLTRAWRGGGEEKEETLISISAVVEAVQRRRRDLQVEPQRGAEFNPADFTLSYSGGGEGRWGGGETRLRGNLE